MLWCLWEQYLVLACSVVRAWNNDFTRNILLWDLGLHDFVLFVGIREYLQLIFHVFVKGYNAFIPWVPYIVLIRNNTAYQYATTKFLIVPYLLCCYFLFLPQRRTTSIWLDTSFLVLISLIPAHAWNLVFCSLSCNTFFDSHWSYCELQSPWVFWIQLGCFS